MKNLTASHVLGVCVVRAAAVFAREILLLRDVLTDLIVLSPVRKPPSREKKETGRTNEKGESVLFCLPHTRLPSSPPRSSLGQLGHCESKGFQRHSLRFTRYLALADQKVSQSNEEPWRLPERVARARPKAEGLVQRKGNRGLSCDTLPHFRLFSFLQMKHEFPCTRTAYQMLESTLVSGALTHALSDVVLTTHYS